MFNVKSISVSFRVNWLLKYLVLRFPGQKQTKGPHVHSPVDVLSFRRSVHQVAAESQENNQKTPPPQCMMVSVPVVFAALCPPVYLPVYPVCLWWWRGETTAAVLQTTGTEATEAPQSLNLPPCSFSSSCLLVFANLTPTANPLAWSLRVTAAGIADSFSLALASSRTAHI